MTMYSLDLPPDTARQLAQEGAAVLMLDVPQATIIGVDQQAFAIGPKFQGIKMLPPGVHFLSWQAAGRGNEFAPTVGCFVCLESRQVKVMRWDAVDETMVALPDDDAEAERLAAGVRRFEFDASLAPYALGQYGAWRALSSHVTAATVQRLSPVGGLISIMGEAEDAGLSHPTTEAEKQLVAQLQRRAGLDAAPREAGSDAAAPAPAGDASPSGRAFYTRLPAPPAPAGRSGAALTAAYTDKSEQLDALLARSYGGDGGRLLGELQFAFIAFVFGQSLDGFQQWKALLALLLGCDAALVGPHARLFERLLDVVLAQLSQTLDAGSSGGAGGEATAVLGVAGLVEELLPGSFLRHLFRGFLESLRDHGDAASPALIIKAGTLEEWLRRRVGWDFRVEALGDDSDDEYAPVVVHLPGEA